jgi:tRNA (Thr-GGU) A37 N-methylase
MDVTPIGYVVGGRTEPADDDWDAETATIRLDDTRFTPAALRGLDAVDGTPVLDLKPAMREFLPRGELRQPPWAGELMAGYW